MKKAEELRTEIFDFYNSNSSDINNTDDHNVECYYTCTGLHLEIYKRISLQDYEQILKIIEKSHNTYIHSESFAQVYLDITIK